MKPTFMIAFMAIAGIACRARPDRTAAQDRAFREDHQQVIAEIGAMIQQDQDLRHYMDYGRTDRRWIDSLEQDFEARHADLDAYSRACAGRRSKAAQDSLAAALAALNRQHTLRMIALINRYGYPAAARIDTGIQSDPVLLLEHGDWSYKDTVMKLLVKELQLKRIDSGSYEFIRWNMNGREGYPLIPGVTIIKSNKDGTTDTIQAGAE